MSDKQVAGIGGKTKIKDGLNGTKIGTSYIFGGNQLRFRISGQ